MPYVAGIMGFTCFVFAWQVDASPLILTTFIGTGILGLLPSRLPSFPKILHRVCATVGALLCFVSFGAFLTQVPLFPIGWYLDPFSTPWLGFIVSGFTAMIVISENSCCLKVDHTLVEVPECVQLFDAFRRRIQQVRTA